MAAALSSPKTSLSIMHWLFAYLKPYRVRVAFAMLALLTGALAWLALGQGVREVVDEGFVANNAAKLNQMVGIVILIGAIGSLAAYVRFYLMIWLGERVSADIRKAVFDHLLSLSPDFFSTTRTGEVISRFTSDTTLLQSVVGMGLSMALRASVTFIGALILMLVTSPMLTLYVLVAVPAVLLPVKLLGSQVRKYARDSQDRVADVGACVDETLHEIHTVQAYTHEDLDRYYFADRIEAVMGAAAKRIHARALMVACILAIGIAAITTVAWLGAHQVLSEAISAGQLTAFMFYAVMAGGSVATLSEVIGEVQKAAGASERLMELLATHGNIVSPDTPSTLTKPVRGELSLQGLDFAYPASPEQKVISALNLEVKAGERVALVGPSGAGKSTLFQLLLRFYDPQAGHIRLDGLCAEQLSLAELRQQFALVPQDAVIFATTVTENIRYGRPDANDEEVRSAARNAMADEFIQTFTDGYETQLGERGVRLSGGQKQRIAIARAILADRPILLLDEATSALDASSEHKVKQALDTLMEGRTTLIIAHRLTTVINADRIVVLDQGQIVATGSHSQLVKDNALYRQFAELQLVS